MTEFELKQGLSRDIELPETVQARLTQACAQAAEGVQTAPRKHSWKAARTGVVVAAAIAVLSIGAMAVSFANHGTVYQAFFGNESYHSTEYTEFYDEYGNFYITSMNEERVPVNEEQAEELVGGYLSDKPYTWQFGEYTLTVENYLLDENTGTAKISYSLHRGGGLEGIVVDENTGHVYANAEGITLPMFCALCNDPDRAFYGEYIGMGISNRFDVARSTKDTLYVTASVAGSGWKAADGLHIQVLDTRLMDDGATPDVYTIADLELPALESLPTTTILDPETGEPAVVFSAIGMKVQVEDIDLVDYIALTYADGVQYVLKDDASNLDNTDYACGFGSWPNMELSLVFNRLVDPEQVASVTIDGRTYAVKQ